MASAARELEPDPLPSDLSNRAPIIEDIERGYVKDEAPYREVARQDPHEVNGIESAGAAQIGGVDSTHADEGSKEEKIKGKGLTEGDDGELLFSTVFDMGMD